MIGLRALGALALAIAGCAGPQRVEEPPPRPADDDLVGLLPSGADAVIDVDVAQLSAWPAARRLLGDGAGGLAAKLGRHGFAPLDDLDALAAALRGAGTDGAEATLLVRGRLDGARIERALGGAAPVQFHGVRLLDGEDASLALLTARAAVFGSPVEVRRAIDVLLGNDEGLRAGDADRVLREALGRAPAAKQGRPAVRAAWRPSPALLAQLEGTHWPVELVDWVAVAIALGDGIDVGVVAGARDRARADELQRRVELELADLRAQPSLRALGVADALGEVKLGRKPDELHLALRLDQAHFDRLAARLANLLSVAR